MVKKYQVAYVRVSREDIYSSEQFSESIRNQLEYIKNYAEKINIHIDKKYIDDGFSGTNFNRPGIKQLINDIKEGKIDTIIVKDMSRLGRNYLETAYYISEYFLNYNIRFIAINDCYDSYNPDDIQKDIMVAIKCLVNDKYAKDTSDKIKKTKYQKSIEKNFLGFTAPYGYKIEKIDGVRTLVEDAEAAFIVKRIFKNVAIGQTMEEIANMLNKEKVIPPFVHLKMTPSNNKKYNYDWSKGAIYRIVKNIVYTGNLYFRKSSKINYKQLKRNYIAINDRSIIENTHIPIISKNLYKKANNKLMKKRKKIKCDYTGIFSDIVICSQCNKKMKILKQVRKSGNIMYRFKCTNITNRKMCTNRTISDSKLQYIIKNILNDMINKYVNEDEIINILYRHILQKDNTEKVIYILKKEINLSSQRIKNIYLKKANKEITLKEFIEAKEKECIHRKNNEIKIKEILKMKNNLISKDELLKKYKDFISNEIIDKKYISEIIDNIYIYKDNTIKIKFKISSIS